METCSLVAEVRHTLAETCVECWLPGYLRLTMVNNAAGDGGGMHPGVFVCAISIDIEVVQKNTLASVGVIKPDNHRYPQMACGGGGPHLKRMPANTPAQGGETEPQSHRNPQESCGDLANGVGWSNHQKTTGIPIGKFFTIDMLAGIVRVNPPVKGGAPKQLNRANPQLTCGAIVISTCLRSKMPPPGSTKVSKILGKAQNL